MAHRRETVRAKWLIALLTLCTVAHAEPWRYKVQVDKMSGHKSEQATLTSSNQLRLGFPYNGTNRGLLLVTQLTEDQPHVGVGIERGQISCPPDPCAIRIRFDDQPPRRVSGSVDNSGPSSLMILSADNDDLKDFRKAKKIMVELPLFREGSQVLEFHPTTPLRAMAPQVKVKPVVRQFVKDEDTCRTKDELVECLERVRECYRALRDNASPAHCTLIASEFPATGRPKD